MYLFAGIFFIICLIFYVLGFCHRKRILRRICRMDFCEKLCVLNGLLEPLGYSYLPAYDIITARRDAWQRDFGYHALYDRTAPGFSMVFDCEPIYFDYEGRTWLIELWKGQYGLSAGGEIGIYCADSILSKEAYHRTLFHSVSDDQMLNFSMQLFFKNRLVFSVEKLHWWLAGFDIGRWCRPEELKLKVSIAFPNCRMLQAFVDALLQAGYPESAPFLCGLTVYFTFALPYARQNRPRLRSAWAQGKNRLACRLFLYITRPLSCTLDRLLFLYYFLPPVFRRMLRFRKCRKQKFSKRGKRRLS